MRLKFFGCNSSHLVRTVLTDSQVSDGLYPLTSEEIDPVLGASSKNVRKGNTRKAKKNESNGLRHWLASPRGEGREASPAMSMS